MRILLAEDERALSAALVRILKHENYSVDAVYDGEAALDYLSSGVYDAAILDIMMPKADGLTVLKTLRGKKSSIPVIILTAKNQVEDKVLGLDLSADDYLTKPFAATELLARLRAVTRRQTATPENSLYYGDLELDKKSFKLKRGGAEILLTSKEFQVAELFMRSPETVISAESIMEKAWGFDSETEITVVWTYISYLRSKLKKLGSSAKIKSVRGAGYRLEG